MMQNMMFPELPLNAPEGTLLHKSGGRNGKLEVPTLWWGKTINFTVYGDM